MLRAILIALALAALIIFAASVFFGNDYPDLLELIDNPKFLPLWKLTFANAAFTCCIC